MYYRKIIPVNELINYLQEKIGELQALGEDEIVSADIEVITTENVISDIIYDREFIYDREYREEYENMEECLKTIPPHILLEYVHYPKEDAKSDGYWDNFQEIKNDIWSDNILPLIEKDLVEKKKEDQNGKQ